MGTPLVADTSNEFSLVAISKDGERIAAVSTTNTVSLWNAHNYELVCPPMKSQIQGFSSSISLLFSSDNLRLTLGCIDGTIITWSAHDGSLVTNKNAKKQGISIPAPEVDVFNTKSGWSNGLATNQASLYLQAHEPISKGSSVSLQSQGELQTQMRWIPSPAPDSGLWAYVDGKLIRSNGAGSATIIDVPEKLNNE